MPVTYKIDTAHRVIRTQCTAPLTFPDVLGHFHQLGLDPDCAGDLDVFLDVTQADSPPESRQLYSLNVELQAIRAKVRFGRCAVVANRDVMFGMMRMFEVLAGKYFQTIRVFREANEAEIWLASPADATSDRSD